MRRHRDPTTDHRFCKGCKLRFFFGALAPTPLVSDCDSQVRRHVSSATGPEYVNNVHTRLLDCLRT
jgi:hypothetical protein